jgi:hypothetical protein
MGMALRESTMHSPGPWTYQHIKSSDPGPFYAIQPAPPSVWSVAWTFNDSADDEANARLMAAAPDLLAACEEAAAYLDLAGDVLSLTVWQRLRAAIDTAKGGVS